MAEMAKTVPKRNGIYHADRRTDVVDIGGRNQS